MIKEKFQDSDFCFLGHLTVYIRKSGDFVGCYHSGTDNDNEQGKIKLLSQCDGPWTAEMSNIDLLILEDK